MLGLGWGVGIGTILPAKVAPSLLPQRQPTVTRDRRVRLSVAPVVTIYNDDPATLDRCPASMLRSTRRPHGLIVVDDGSAARAKLENDPSDRHASDADKDGIACEVETGEPTESPKPSPTEAKRTDVLPKTGGSDNTPVFAAFAAFAAFLIFSGAALAIGARKAINATGRTCPACGRCAST